MAPNYAATNDAFASMYSASSDVSRSRTAHAIDAVAAKDRATTQSRWLSAVASLAAITRPDIFRSVSDYLDVKPLQTSPLSGLTIGELGVVYEAILALSDRQSRKSEGQYFTPDDVAEFMASHLVDFSPGVWIDPCCGIGNLAWHLVATEQANQRPEFLRSRLILVDQDPVALKSAVVLLSISFAEEGDQEAVGSLAQNAYTRDYLDIASLPEHDFAILNPPYARSSDYPAYQTAGARDLYAFFLEKVCRTTEGFIAITPASYLSGTKFAMLRRILEREHGGRVYVFDNVPDTCFRGFKYGSENTSNTNFVRAAITVSSSLDKDWKITPILRWASRSRESMFRNASRWLSDRRIAPDGTWAKLMPGFDALWSTAMTAPQVRDFVQPRPTPWFLEIASTPRYYISASTRVLDRSSKQVLYFESRADRDRVYLALNSSLAYWWWRVTDGGISLTKRTLLSTPSPTPADEIPGTLLASLFRSDELDVVTKLNSGRLNENVKRPRELTAKVDQFLLGESHPDFSWIYRADMFASAE